MGARLNRRSFLGVVLGLSAAAGGAAAQTERTRRAPEKPPAVNDNDQALTGDVVEWVDARGRGRGPERRTRTGVTDTDAARNFGQSDAPGRGRGPVRR